jgi:hypothetical protein
MLHKSDGEALPPTDFGDDKSSHRKTPPPAWAMPDTKMIW